MADREELSWDQFGAAARQLASTVAEDGFAPDVILAVARGGLFLAGALGYALGVKNVHMMNVEYYTGVDERLNAPVLLPPFFPEPAGRWLMAREAKVREGEVPYPFISRKEPYVPASLPVLVPEQAVPLSLIGYGLGSGRLTAQAMVMTADGKEVGEGMIGLVDRDKGGAEEPDRLPERRQDAEEARVVGTAVVREVAVDRLRARHRARGHVHLLPRADGRSEDGAGDGDAEGHPEEETSHRSQRLTEAEERAHAAPI